MAGALFSEDRQRGPGDVDRAVEDGLHLGAEVVHGDLFDRDDVGVAGVVDHDIEPAECLDRGLDRLPGLFLVGDVEREQEGARAVSG
jgi:hypothetical protein